MRKRSERLGRIGILPPLTPAFTSHLHPSCVCCEVGPGVHRLPGLTTQTARHMGGRPKRIRCIQAHIHTVAVILKRIPPPQCPIPLARLLTNSPTQSRLIPIPSTSKTHSHRHTRSNPHRCTAPANFMSAPALFFRRRTNHTHTHFTPPSYPHHPIPIQSYHQSSLPTLSIPPPTSPHPPTPTPPPIPTPPTPVPTTPLSPPTIPQPDGPEPPTPPRESQTNASRE